jgi:hypothetical protein
VLRETWTLGDVRDVEAFCGDVIAKFTRGERAGHKPGSDAFFSPADHDDAMAYLLGEAWIAWQKFNPVDDGRGTNRFSGFLVWTLHRRLVDFLRARYGSTRYNPERLKVRSVTPTYDIERHISGAWLDPEYDGADALDLEAAQPGTREALELLRPWLDGEVQWAKEIGPEAHHAVALVRGEARRQRLEPASLVDGDRQALADRARDLRQQGMHYREIASELGLSSAQVASGLLRAYHPELVKVRAKRRRRPPSDTTRTVVLHA